MSRRPDIRPYSSHASRHDLPPSDIGYILSFNTAASRPFPHRSIKLSEASSADDLAGYRPSPNARHNPLLHCHPTRKFARSGSTLHNRIPIRAALLVPRDPKHIVATDQHLTQCALILAVDPLNGAAELHVHVAVDADQAAGVLGLSPLEADAHVVVDKRLQHGPRVHRDELCGELVMRFFFEGACLRGVLGERRTLMFAGSCVYFFVLMVCCGSLLRFVGERSLTRASAGSFVTCSGGQR